MVEAGDSHRWIVWGVPVIYVVSLFCFSLAMYLLRRYIRGPMYKGRAFDMTGKTVLITGANTGIGKETARDLSRRGAKVTLLCRNIDKGFATAREIAQDTGKDVDVQKLDLSSFESIRECAASLNNQHPKIHVLINNAGIMLCPQWETKDGLEMQIGTNHFGHFLLTLLLLENIKTAAPSRIITVSSLGHKFGKMNWKDLHMKKKYSAGDSYAQSKLANVLFSSALARKLECTGVTTYALHPGAVQTELARHIPSTYGRITNAIMHLMALLFFKDPVLGAQTSIACAVDANIGNETGLYYNDCKKETASKRGRDKDDAEKLWKISLETVGLDDFRI